MQTVRDGERVWVVLKRACEALGIDESGQRQKLAEKPWSCAELISAVLPDGRKYEMFCVDLDTLPMWLATIDADQEPRIRDLELGERLGYARPADIRELIKRLQVDANCREFPKLPRWQIGLMACPPSRRPSSG